MPNMKGFFWFSTPTGEFKRMPSRLMFMLMQHKATSKKYNKNKQSNNTKCVWRENLQVKTFVTTCLQRLQDHEPTNELIIAGCGHHSMIC